MSDASQRRIGAAARARLVRAPASPEPLDARRRHRGGAGRPYLRAAGWRSRGARCRAVRHRRARAQPHGRTSAGWRRAEAADRQRRSIGLSGENLAAAVTDPLIVFDGAGAVVHANAAATAAFGALHPGILAAAEIPRARDAGDDRGRAVRPGRLARRRLQRAPAHRARLPRHRLGGRPRHRALSSWSSRTRARRAASTACAPTSSPMPATNCARRWPRSPASSRRCAARPATTRRRATSSCRSCRSRRRAWRA